MRIHCTLILVLYLLFNVFSPALSQTQDTPKGKVVRDFGEQVLRKFPIVVCYKSGESGTLRIPPPEIYLQRKANARTEAGANIVVQYDGNFPNAAVNAFEYAVDIWRNLIYSPVTINVQANWSALGANVLGSANTTSYRRSPLFPKFPVWYPQALAEKFIGRNLNNNEADIVANFSSNNPNWYFGIDGRPASNQIDFASIVLHELAHGLGFAAQVNITDNNGVLGLESGGRFNPTIYDTYVADERGRFLADTNIFRNPSAELATAYRSDNLFFESPYVISKNNGQGIKLYAPSTFSRGSSISHVDQSTYRGTRDALMTPQASNGESILDPGPLATNILAEMGWVLTKIEHTPLNNSDQIDKPINFRVRLVSDTTSNFSRFTVNLIYSEDRFRTAGKTEVMRAGANGEFLFQLPAPNANKEIFYYFSAKSPEGREILLPSTASQLPFGFSLAIDNDPPVITHTPDAFILESTDTLLITATITDLLGVDTAYIEYAINDQPLIGRPLLDLGGDAFGNIIVFPAGSLRAGNTLKYRITAIDVSSKKNKGFSPSADGFHTVRVEGFGQARTSYENNFDSPSDDFFGASFRIEQPDGFTNGAIHSDHPYKDGTGLTSVPGYSGSDYIYQLKFPIIVKNQDAFIRFDEIVLVEPGDPGTRFGDFEFWDYVIVEASRDRGRNWTPLLDGYDSRANNDWLTAYNRRIVDNNSTTVGTPSLFRPRIINMLDKLRPNDEVLIRFRLFSDEAAHGWGWAIDNLQIQSGVVGLDEYLVSKEDVKVYPNPSQGTFAIYAQFKKNVKQLKTVVTDLAGRQIYEDNSAVRGLIYQQNIALPQLSAGMYLVHLYIDGNLITKKIMIQP